MFTDAHLLALVQQLFKHHLCFSVGKKSRSFGRNDAAWWRRNAGAQNGEEAGEEGGGRSEKERGLREVMAARCFGIIVGEKFYSSRSHLSC